ncbi:MAG: hypothetical protein JSU01_09390 [Bacteroidetes bacterium]|nr:hypothetical protein [Bacteroidota bacterium]
MEKQKNTVSRKKLLDYFKNGKIPSEEHYSHLINSMIHKYEDGFSKDDENGLNIYPEGSYNALVSFYKNISAPVPFFQIAKDKADPDSLKMQPAVPPDSDDDPDASAVFFHTSGKVGIGKECDDRYKVDIDGFVGVKGRIGTYKSGQVKADGVWYPIITGLNNGQAFEIMARTGKVGTGKFAIMHAYALSVFGRKGGRIRRTNAYYGFWWNKINLRWTGSSRNYNLEMKTNSNYGDGVIVYYTVTKLWDDELFLSGDYYYKDNIVK